MKAVIIIFLFFLLSFNGYCQSVFYGYPSTPQTIGSGDAIVLTIPVHNSGRYIHNEDFDPLVDLINENKLLKFKIKINLFWLNTDSENKNYCDFLCIYLREYLEFKKTSTNYEVVNVGSTNPIFFNKKDERYKKFNNRIEIAVE